MRLFPASAGMSQLRGLIDILKYNNGIVSISELSRETRKTIDVLFPLLNAADLLGFCEIKNGRVVLTEKGRKVNSKNFANLVAESLKDVEPFKSVLQALKKNPLNIIELAQALEAQGVVLYAEPATNVELLKSMLIKWGIRSGLLNYESKSDKWRLSKKFSQ